MLHAVPRTGVQCHHILQCHNRSLTSSLASSYGETSKEEDEHSVSPLNAISRIMLHAPAPSHTPIMISGTISQTWSFFQVPNLVLKIFPLVRLPANLETQSLTSPLILESLKEIIPSWYQRLPPRHRRGRGSGSCGSRNLAIRAILPDPTPASRQTPIAQVRISRIVVRECVPAAGRALAPAVQTLGAALVVAEGCVAARVAGEAANLARGVARGQLCQ
ncbi:hypothetical protein BJ170DRAFT_420335 [Xylariales sp. AK1849]|nr:hypothetical protein BJ170DRAFT_420335 [Xylariales sp. AK1849]